MSDLKVTIIQSELHWEQPRQNLAMFSEHIASIKGGTDLIVLPEMFTTGFTMNARPLAEPQEGPTLIWMKEQAASTNAAVYGSVIIVEDDRIYNRGLFVQPDGAVTSYDKRHLFRMAKEHETFAAGSQRKVVAWRGWGILLQVCYDLRFPVFSRNRNDYDLSLYVANWPEARRAPWTKLLQARAIENQCYVVGVNRVGEDGNEIRYSGDSMVIDPKGEIIAAPRTGKVTSCNTRLSMKDLTGFRERFPVAMDADEFELK